MHLSAIQNNAINEMNLFVQSNKPFYGLLGYAGTGKTYTICHWLAQFRPSDRPDFVVAAPTHQAKNIIKNLLASIGLATINVTTIHSLLGLVLDPESGSNKCTSSSLGKLHDYRVILIDESSMVSDDVTRELTNQYGNQRIIIIGDPAQLPPPDLHQNAKFAQIWELCRTEHTVLTEVIRCNNSILSTATELRHTMEECGIASPFSIPIKGQYKDIKLGIFQMENTVVRETEDIERVKTIDALDVINNQFGNFTPSRENLHECAILAYTNQTVRQYNKFVLDAIGSNGVSVGDFLLATKPYKSEDVTVTNGTIVKIVTSEHGKWDNKHLYEVHNPNIPVEWDGNTITATTASGFKFSTWLPNNPEQWIIVLNLLFQIADYKTPWKDATHEMKSARHAIREMNKASLSCQAPYAMTVHRAQGTTLQSAIIDVSDMRLCRDYITRARLYYTSFTRVKDYIVVVA